jgi:hypothetical protein
MRRSAIASLVLTLSAAAHAAGTRDPLELPLRQYGAMLAAALLGGFVSWIGRVRAGQAAVTAFSFVGEMCTSAFAGLLCFWTFEAWGIDRLYTIAAVGVAGHMGTRAIVLAERRLQAVLKIKEGQEGERG